MAASVALSALRTRVRFEADMVSSTRATDADINRLINTHLAKLYDALVAAGPSDYYMTATTITTVAGTISYSLPADFRSLIGVFSQDSATRLREIQEVPEGTLAAFDAPQGTYNLTLRYVAAPPVLVADGDTFDGVSGWDELIVQQVARALMRRERRDTSAFDAAVAEERDRVMRNAPKRNQSGPRYINDTESAAVWPLLSIVASINGWRLDAGNLNLYQMSAVWPWP